MEALLKLMALVQSGIDDGSLTRFIAFIVAVGLLVYLTMTGQLSKPEMQIAVGLIQLIIGFYFGGQGTTPSKPGAA